MAKKKKRADGRYCKNVTIGRNDDGSLKRRMVYGDTQAELDLKVAELLLQRDKGVIIEDKNKTVGEWADEWLKTYTTHLKDGTKNNHKKMINKYIKTSFKDTRLKDLKQFHVQSALNKITAPSQPKRFLITLNYILDAAVENDLIAKNVAKGLNAPKFTEKEKRALSENEINKIKATIFVIRDIFIFLIYSGLRISELINLTWQNIDIKNKKLHIVGDVKTPHSNRTVPIFEPNLKILKSLNKKRVKNIEPDIDFVFLYQGEKCNPNILAKKRYEYCEMCGFDFTFHQCRHTFATILYNAGVDIKQAQEWLGHSNFNTTMNIYTHLNEQNKITSTDKVNEYLKSV